MVDWDRVWTECLFPALIVMLTAIVSTAAFTLVGLLFGPQWGWVAAQMIILAVGIVIGVRWPRGTWLVKALGGEE